MREQLTASTAEKAFPVVDDAQGTKMREAIAAAKAEGDSVGGIIEVAAFGLPVGLGDPMFGGMENRIAAIVFGIPAVKGVEFGEGFGAARLRGSENNDGFCVRDGKIRTCTNHCGGILGGITNGMPLRFRAAVKPTPSIFRPQRSVNLETMEETTLQIQGRHDPCIVPRAVPVMEAAAAIAIYDALLGYQNRKDVSRLELSDYRNQIDHIDKELIHLFAERMDVAAEIAAYKKEHGLAVLDPARERAKLLDVAEQTPEALQEYAVSLYSLLFELSRSYQNRLLEEPSALTEEIQAAIEQTPKLFPQRAAVACQGVAGAYSQLACDKLFGLANVLYFNSL